MPRFWNFVGFGSLFIFIFAWVLVGFRHTDDLLKDWIALVPMVIGGVGMLLALIANWNNKPSEDDE